MNVWLLAVSYSPPTREASATLGTHFDQSQEPYWALLPLREKREAESLQEQQTGSSDLMPLVFW